MDLLNGLRLGHTQSSRSLYEINSEHPNGEAGRERLVERRCLREASCKRPLVHSDEVCLVQAVEEFP